MRIIGLDLGKISFKAVWLEDGEGEEASGGGGGDSRGRWAR